MPDKETAGLSTPAPDRPLRGRFRIGAWQVEPDCNRLSALTKPDNSRSLEPRLMHLLCFLAANAPAVVSREQLIDELWPRVVVNENSLTRAVSELRKHLHSQGQPGLTYIETIPKKGYRLLPAVLQMTGALSGRSASDSTDLSSGQRRVLSRHSLGHALAACLAVVALGLWLSGTATSLSSRSGHDVTPMPRAQPAHTPFTLSGATASLASLTPDSVPTTAPALAASMALSPDGSVLALLRHEGDLSQVYLLRTDGDGRPVLVFSSTETLVNLQWSPIGYALLFARKGPGPAPTPLGPTDTTADLVMLDLKTMTLKTLIDNVRRSGEAGAAV